MRKKTYPKEILWSLLEPLGGAQRVRFDKTRCFFQFAIPGLKLAIEIDSGLLGRFKWTKYNRATTLGWRYMRFTEHEVRAKIAEEMIDQYIRARIK